MKYTLFSQYGHPRGLLGSLACKVMALKNRVQNEWTIDLLGLDSHHHVLEIGFGPGVAISRISKIVRKGYIAGVDHSQVMTSQARRRNAKKIKTGNVVLHQCSVTDVPYPANSFDRILAIDSSFFWPQPVKQLKRLFSLLNPGGLLALSVRPRWAKSHTEVKLIGLHMMDQLRRAGFTNIRLETQPASPVPYLCVIGNS